MSGSGINIELPSLRSGFLRGALVFVAAILALFAIPSPVHASDAYPIKGIAGKCLDVRGGKAVARTIVQIYTCNSTAAQLWQQPGDGTIRNRGLCLDVKWGSKANKTGVWLYDCNGSSAQQWKVTSDGSVKSLHSSFCLDDKYGITEDGNIVWTYTCNGTKSQRWTTIKPQAIVPKPTPAPAPVPAYTPPSAASQPAPRVTTYYKNCSAARAAGAAPVYAGQPGYGTHLDRDNDGIGCE